MVASFLQLACRTNLVECFILEMNYDLKTRRAEASTARSPAGVVVLTLFAPPGGSSIPSELQLELAVLSGRYLGGEDGGRVNRGLMASPVLSWGPGATVLAPWSSSFPTAAASCFPVLSVPLLLAVSTCPLW